MATKDNTVPIATALHNDLSEFLGEAKAIADLLIAAADYDAFCLDDETVLHVAQAQWRRADSLKKRLEA